MREIQNALSGPRGYEKSPPQQECPNGPSVERLRRPPVPALPGPTPARTSGVPGSTTTRMPPGAVRPHSSSAASSRDAFGRAGERADGRVGGGGN